MGEPLKRTWLLRHQPERETLIKHAQTVIRNGQQKSDAVLIAFGSETLEYLRAERTIQSSPSELLSALDLALANYLEAHPEAMPSDVKHLEIAKWLTEMVS